MQITITKIEMLTFKKTQRIKTIFQSLPMIKTKSSTNLLSKKEESLKKSIKNFSVTLNVKRS